MTAAIVQAHEVRVGDFVDAIPFRGTVVHVSYFADINKVSIMLDTRELILLHSHRRICVKDRRD